MKIISKNLKDIPSSLISDDNELTHKRRLELINKKKYIDKDSFNNRYKTDDIREKLVSIYNHKCAFCEQKVEQYNIEHFRPKKIYYWLAYSWDNLILACHYCNNYKGIDFEIEGKRAKCPKLKELKGINTISSRKYDFQEHPKLINPEKTDPKPYLVFEKDGRITSMNEKFRYTIDTCKIDRKYLNDSRRKIIDKFKREINSELVYSSTLEEQKGAIDILVRCFKRNANDNDSEFLAFRNFAVEHDWLKDIVKDLISIR